MNKSPYLYGEVTDKKETDNGSSFRVKDEKGNEYYCRYSDLLTEGFRTLSIGDTIRFIPKVNGDLKLATYIIKIRDLESEENLFY